MNTYNIINGDNLDVLKTFPDNYFDSIVSDPPYGISFLGKDWDSKKATETTSKLVAMQNLPSGMKHTSLADDLEFQYWMRGVFSECIRVLKPGGHLLAFSAARTYHHMAMAAQTAGFEIRDQIMWIYGSGFPKSQDVGRSIQRSIGVKETSKNANARSKQGDSIYDGGYQKEVPGDNVVCTSPEAQQWEGWGTALKPAHEPIVMARKPVKQSIAKNAQQYGTGALNIDACRIEFTHGEDPDAIFAGGGTDWTKSVSQEKTDERATLPDRKAFSSDKGRFPSNVIGEIAEPYQKYFYCPKVGRKERHVGFDVQNIMQIGNTHPDAIKKHPLWDPSIGGDAARLKQKIIDMGQYKGNNHPTVKPQALMEYLCKLVTPPGGHILDPFNGSGSTGMAAVKSGFTYTGIELDPSYCEISRKRIAAWNQEELPPSDHFSYDATE